jgi:hypothetical protein
MLEIKPQFITDSNGIKSHVILSIEQFNQLMEVLDILVDNKLYEDAIKEDDGERISLEEYLEKRKLVNV